MLNKAALDMMRKTQEASMMDKCRIYPYRGAADDSYGAGKGTFGDPVESICGLKMDLSDKQGRDQHYELIEADAEMRLPLGVGIGPKDKVEVIERFGSPVTGLTYEVVKFPNTGPSGQRVLLKAVYA